jgi:hypothetical protein
MADSNRYALIRKADQILNHQEIVLNILNDMHNLYISYDKPEAEFIELLMTTIIKFIDTFTEFREEM